MCLLTNRLCHDFFNRNRRGRRVRISASPAVRKRVGVMKLPYFSIPLLAIVGLLSLLAGCGGGSSSDSAQDIGLRNVGLDSANFGCDGDCPNQSLSVAEVQQVIQQAVAAAQQLGTAATIAVTDRVGNVLGVYQMAGAASTTRIDGQIGAVGGLEGVDVPSTFAAI